MIRPAQTADLAALRDIYNDAIRTTTATFDVEEKDMDDRRRWLEEHTGKHVVYVWEEQGRIAGFGSLSEYRPRRAYGQSVELSVYVDGDFRRRGIGRKLMEQLISFARAHEDIHTVISVITGENAASIRLHEQLGFVPCGRIRDVGRKFGRYLDVEIYQLLV